MPFTPPPGAPDVVKELRRQGRWIIGIAALTLAVSVAILLVALLR